MNESLKDKVILVTGGTKGIGKECVHAFASTGSRIAVAARSEKAVQEMVDLLREKGIEAMGVMADISSVESIHEMVKQVVHQFGTIDVLVNSAGINKPTKAIDVTEENWDSIVDTNLKGAFFTSQAVAKVMLLKGKGKIINLSSQMGFVGYYDRAPYCASKGGLEIMTKALAVEWAPKICINTVAPTFIETPLTEEMFKNKEFYQDVINKIPMGRVGKPEDVVGAVLFLASDLSDMVTGTSIKVDGGWTAW